ncbi:Adenylosuccinate synthetase [Ascobolus immersus RN42]|uniref:Adenylosuccinate synthetase n=1 Tax=Ascobolus immersus RN42 TaxID=1160509 RepID=A0A3N4HER3_ASCIM|nr:Adenylosuccinate synthetase [Ascobolus immersus RN42]
MTTIILGAQFGDEGKGKLVDVLCRSADICARSAGGSNAGHTVVANGITYDFHLLPSGLVHEQCTNVIGSGVVAHIPSFFDELEAAQSKGLNTEGRIKISNRAHIVLDLHRTVDGLEEEELGKNKSIGTTKRGIGPTYANKASRNGLRIADLYTWDTFEEKFRRLVAGYRKRFGHLEGFSYDDAAVEAELVRYKEYAERLKPFVVDAVTYMSKATASNKRIIVEGANALLLDIDYGTYPFVTSSNASLGGCITGLALNPLAIKEIIGVVKAYTTRVGGGPFPTELFDEVGEQIATIGHEIGVTTKRKRRCGWLDLVLVKYSHSVNHYTSINLTKLDILDAFDEIKVCEAYEVDGQIIEDFPADAETLAKVKPVYKSYPGWKSSPIMNTTSIKQWSQTTVDYVRHIEEFLGVKISSVGVGPKREHLIEAEVAGQSVLDNKN